MKGDWSELKTSEGRLILNANSMERTRYDLTMPRNTPQLIAGKGHVLSPSVLPITHCYYCLRVDDSEVTRLLSLERSEVIERHSSVDDSLIWIKVTDKREVRGLSDFYDWTSLDEGHDWSEAIKKDSPETGMYYDYPALFKEYAEQADVSEMLKEFNLEEFDLNLIDLEWYRYTNDGHIAIDEACNKYVFSWKPSSASLKEVAPMFWIVPVKQVKELATA